MNRERRAVRRPGGAGFGGAGPVVAGLGVWRARRLIWRERCQVCRAQPLVCRERPLVCRTQPLAWQVRRLALLTRPLAWQVRRLVLLMRLLAWQVRRLTYEAFCDVVFGAVACALADVAFGAVAYVACGELTRFRSFRSPHRRSHRTGSRATRSAHRTGTLIALVRAPHRFVSHTAPSTAQPCLPCRSAHRVVPPAVVSSAFVVALGPRLRRTFLATPCSLDSSACPPQLRRFGALSFAFCRFVGSLRLWQGAGAEGGQGRTLLSWQGAGAEGAKRESAKPDWIGPWKRVRGPLRIEEEFCGSKTETGNSKAQRGRKEK